MVPYQRLLHTARKSRLYHKASSANPAPFARYNVTVHKAGYGSVQNIGVPVFAGVVSTQPVTLIPLSEFEEDRPEQILETPEGSNPLV